MELEKALDTVFDGEPAALAEPAPAQEPQPEPAPVEQAPGLPPEPQEPAPAPEEPKDHSVPLAKFLDTRDELKEARRRIAEFEQRQQVPQAVPDPFDDPQGFAQHQHRLVQEAIIADRFERSNEEAIEKHGEDAVTQAIEWATRKAQANPGFAAEYMSKTRPMDWIVRQHKQDATVREIGDRPLEDFVKDYIAKNPNLLSGLAPQAVAPAIPVNAAIPQQAPPVAPPRSLVDAPSSGGVDHVPMGLSAAIGAAFPR